MTLQELFQRIIRAHLVVIGVCVLLPVVAVVALHQRQAAQWSGTVRLQVDSTAPTSTTEADALSSRVLALATTPSLVAQALEQAGLTANATDVAEHHVTASRLGESSIVGVTVTQATQARAGALASALVDQVTAFLNNGSRPALDARVATLDREISAAQSQLHAMTARIASAGASRQQSLLVGVQGVQNRLNALTTERTALLQAKLTTDQAVVIDGSDPEVVQVGSGLVPRVALALVLGLLVGLATAVLRETVSPRLAGIRSLARELGAPVLGRTDESPADLSAALTRAARRQGVETVVVMGVDEKDEVAASSLLAGLPAGTPVGTTADQAPTVAAGRPAGRAGSSSAKARNGRPREAGRGAVDDPFADERIAVTALGGLSARAERTAGVVVVSSGSSRVRDLESLRDRVSALRWPVVGIVEVTHHHHHPATETASPA